jgi:hypothetical protein
MGTRQESLPLVLAGLRPLKLWRNARYDEIRQKMRMWEGEFYRQGGEEGHMR